MGVRHSPQVLLIHPARPRERTYPLGLACLAAVATLAGASVVGLDLRLHSVAELRATLRRHAFDFVGLTALSTTIDDVAAVAAIVRKMQSTAFVVVGGPHATLAPGNALVRTRADAAVRGDGEAPFAALLAGRLDAPGIMLRGSDTPPPIHVERNLDALPLPDRRVFPVGDYYRHGIHGSGVRTAVVATRGCRLACGYCSAPASSLGLFRTRPVASVVDEIRALQRDHGVDAIVFEDDNLVLDAAWCRSLFDALATGVPGMRYDLPNGVHPGLVDEPLIDLMQRAGVRSLAFGIETTSPEERDALGRRFDPMRLAAVCRRARDAGMVTTGYLLVGLPHQSPWSAMSQVGLLRSLPLDMLHVSTFLDLPGQSLPGLRGRRALRRWTAVRRAMYAAWYADPGRAAQVWKLAGGNAHALGRLAARAIAWWR